MKSANTIKVTALAAVAMLAAAPASPASSDIVQCNFGKGAKMTDLALVIPGGPKRSPSRHIEISAVPGADAERAAIARYVAKSASSINQPYAQIFFQVDTKTGFVTQVAKNGDGVTYAIDLENAIAGDPHYGACSNPKSLFNLWY